MKKIISILVIILFGRVTFAEIVPNQIPQTASSVAEQSQVQETKDEDSQDKETSLELPKTEVKIQNPDLVVVEKGNQNFYYDKYGKFIARDKNVNGQIFFYNNVGQYTGKSVNRNEKTYYYDGMNKFAGYCDEKECFDNDLKTLGTVPPLPKIKKFVPIIDNKFLNSAPTQEPKEE